MVIRYLERQGRVGGKGFAFQLYTGVTGRLGCKGGFEMRSVSWLRGLHVVTIWGFVKIRGTFLGVPIIRITVF